MHSEGRGQRFESSRVRYFPTKGPWTAVQVSEFLKLMFRERKGCGQECILDHQTIFIAATAFITSQEMCRQISNQDFIKIELLLCTLDQSAN